ncbi:IS5 family transposase [Rhizobacter sp. SG703]|nr:IS5 family transposase [Rhizobacter sp. SG703]
MAKTLRTYWLQQLYGLADEALEDALYDSQALQDFVGIDLSHESVPDGTTLLKFRRLLNDNNLTRALFDEINAHLGEKGLLMHAGTIVDVTIIAAPSRRRTRTRHEIPRCTKRRRATTGTSDEGAHWGGCRMGLVHSLVGTAANVNDVTQVDALLLGREGVAFGDAGYGGVGRRTEAQGLSMFNRAFVAFRVQRPANTDLPFMQPKAHALFVGRDDATRARASDGLTEEHHPSSVGIGVHPENLNVRAETVAFMLTMAVKRRLAKIRRNMAGLGRACTTEFSRRQKTSVTSHAHHDFSPHLCATLLPHRAPPGCAHQPTAPQDLAVRFTGGPHAADPLHRHRSTAAPHRCRWLSGRCPRTCA